MSHVRKMAAKTTISSEFTIVGLYLTQDDRAIICVQAENSIYKLKQLVGPADLKEAKSSHQFSLRASFASQSDEFYGMLSHLITPYNTL